MANKLTILDTPDVMELEWAIEDARVEYELARDKYNKAPLALIDHLRDKLKQDGVKYRSPSYRLQAPTLRTRTRIDYRALLQHLMIPQHVVERFRKCRSSAKLGWALHKYPIKKKPFDKT